MLAPPSILPPRQSFQIPPSNPSFWILPFALLSHLMAVPDPGSPHCPWEETGQQSGRRNGSDKKSGRAKNKLPLSRKKFPVFYILGIWLHTLEPDFLKCWVFQLQLSSIGPELCFKQIKLSILEKSDHRCLRLKKTEFCLWICKIRLIISLILTRVLYK